MFVAIKLFRTKLGNSLYSNNYFNISRDSLYFDTRPLDHTIRFYSYLYLSIYPAFYPPHTLAFHTFLPFICI